MIGLVFNSIFGHFKVFAIAAAIIAFVGWMTVQNRTAYNRGMDKVENQYQIAALRRRRRYRQRMVKPPYKPQSLQRYSDASMIMQWLPYAIN